MAFALPAPWVTKFEEIQQNFEALTQALVDLMPGSLAQAGDLKMTGRTTAPTGWRLCDGSAISRTQFARLFAAIGTTYGVGDGSTTFNVPDLLGRAPVGAGTGSGLTAKTLGTKIGVETPTMPAHLTGIENQTHVHGAANGLNFMTSTLTVGLAADGGAQPTWYPDTWTGTTATQNANHNHNVAAVGSATDGNVPPSTVVNYVIKL